MGNNRVASQLMGLRLVLNLIELVNYLVGDEEQAKPETRIISRPHVRPKRWLTFKE
jgi:hypothetical protein